MSAADKSSYPTIRFHLYAEEIKPKVPIKAAWCIGKFLIGGIYSLIIN